jgi:hypothetical protein
MNQYLSTDRHGSDDNVDWFEIDGSDYGITDGSVSGEVKLLNSDGYPLAVIENGTAINVSGLFGVMREICALVPALVDYSPADDRWYQFKAHNRESQYGYGSDTDASAYQDFLNRKSDINHFQIQAMTPGEARALDTGANTDGFRLDEVLSELREADMI